MPNQSIMADTQVGDRRQVRPVRLVFVGLGGIGRATVAECLKQEAFSVMGAVDPAFRGTSLGGLVVQGGLDELDRVDADVAVIATSSSVQGIRSQVEWSLDNGMHVVSSCEELTFPWASASEAASDLSAKAIAAGKSILACGVNPGFVMDVLPVFLSSASQQVQSLRVRREADLSRRRPQLRAKLGVGMDMDEWNNSAKERRYGHVGLVESALLCAAGLGWEVENRHFIRTPIQEHDKVIGVHEEVEVRCRGDRAISLELLFAIGAHDEDSVHVEGTPPIRVLIESGLHGDSATVARILHSAAAVDRLAPGLRLPIEAPISAFSVLA